MQRDDWNRRYGTSELVWTAQPNRFLVAEVSSLPPGRALDLAAGEGRNAVWLAERGWQVIAVDFSDVAIEKGRGLAQARGVQVEWQERDLTDYEPEPRAFELVVVMYFACRGRRWSRCQQAARAPGGTFCWSDDAENLERAMAGRVARALAQRTSSAIAGDSRQKQPSAPSRPRRVRRRHRLFGEAASGDPAAL
jgi:SAM-dependent methyltransferase